MFGKTTTQGCVTKTYKKHNNISYPELPLSFAQIPIHSGHCPVQIWTDFRVYFGKQIKRDRRKTTTTTTTRIEIDGPVHSASAYARIVYEHTYIYVCIYLCSFYIPWFLPWELILFSFFHSFFSTHKPTALHIVRIASASLRLGSPFFRESLLSHAHGTCCEIF